MMNGLLAWRIAAVALGFPLLTFGFGWALLRHVRGLDAEERFAASWGVSFAFLALSEFVAFLSGVEQTACHLGTVLFMLFVATAGFFHKCQATNPLGPDFWRMTGLCALGYLHLLCIQMLLPIYVGGNWFGDWWMHYDEALVFRGVHGVDTEWFGVYTLASRTPLFNLVAAFLLSLAGNDFWVFQLGSTLLNACFLSALYLVIRDLFDPRVARIGLALASVNLWLLHNAWFTWPKMLVVYFLLLGLHFYLRFLRERATAPQLTSRWLFGFWVCGLLAFLTHQVALVYLGALLVHGLFLAWRAKVYRPGRAEWVGLPALAALLLAPWYGWLALRFGMRRLLTSTPVTRMDEHASFGLASLAGAVLFNLAASFVPVPLLHTMTSGSATFNELYEGATSFYFSLLTGALTLSLCVFLLAAFVWRRASWQPALTTNPQCSAVWTFALLGGFGALALHPARFAHGCAHAAFFPTVAILLLLAWGMLSRASRPWAMVTCVGMVVEFLAMFWSHVWLATTTRFLDDPNSNWNLKEVQNVVFLHDCLGAGKGVFMIVTGIVQLVIVTLLLRTLWHDPSGKRHASVGVGQSRSRERPDTGMIVAAV